MNSRIIILLSVIMLSISGCSSTGRIPVVSDVGEIVNMPIELAQWMLSVEDSATKKAKRDLSRAQKENKELKQTLKEKEEMLSHIQKNLRCLRVERKGNSILFLPEPGCY